MSMRESAHPNSTMLTSVPLPAPYLEPLFSGYFDTFLIVSCALRGMVPARCFIDRVQDPRVGLLLSPEGIFLAGDPAAAADLNLYDWLQRLAREQGENSLELHYAPLTWAEYFPRLLQADPPLVFSARYFECDSPPPNPAPAPPPGFALRAVDEALLNDVQITGVAQLREKILHNAFSIERFLMDGIGFCLMHENQIVSECLSDCRLNERIEIGISTHPSFRRRGFAALSVGACLRLAFTQGIRRVGWHAAENNIGSVRTALRAGFQSIRTYPILEWIPDQATNLLANARFQLFAQRDAQTASSLFNRAFTMRDPQPFELALAGLADLWNGDIPTGTRKLRQAKTLGQDIDSLIDSHPALIHLRNDAAIRSALETLAGGQETGT